MILLSVVTLPAGALFSFAFGFLESDLCCLEPSADRQGRANAPPLSRQLRLKPPLPGLSKFDQAWSSVGHSALSCLFSPGSAFEVTRLRFSAAGHGARFHGIWRVSLLSVGCLLDATRDCIVHICCGMEQPSFHGVISGWQ